MCYLDDSYQKYAVKTENLKLLNFHISWKKTDTFEEEKLIQSSFCSTPSVGKEELPDITEQEPGMSHYGASFGFESAGQNIESQSSESEGHQVWISAFCTIRFSV